MNCTAAAGNGCTRPTLLEPSSAPAYLVEIPEEERALLADAFHLCEVVVLQRTRAVRPEDEALQQLDRYVQSDEADSAPCRNEMETIKWTCGRNSWSL